MKRSLRYVLAVAFVVAITAVAVSAMAFTGHDTSATRAVRKPEGAHSSRSTEQIRAERRESFSRTGCSKHMRQMTPDV